MANDQKESKVTPWRVAAGICVVVAGVCCFLPLVSLLGYESAATFGVLGALLSAWLTSKALGPFEKGALDDRFEHGAISWFLTHWVKNLALLLLPFGLLCLNALRVQNCDLGLGVKFWLVIPTVSVLIAHTLVWVLSVRVRRPRVRVLLAVMMLLANALAFGVHIMLEPPINGHLWLIGYFSGSIYDEALGLPGSLVWYRLQNVVGVLALVWGVEVWRTKGWRRLAPWAVMASVFWVGLWASQESVGIGIQRETIAERLAGKVETKHFVIYYPANEAFEQNLELLIQDHEFRYAQMKAYFGTDPVALHGEKVRSFVYPDRETKGFLMGARRTLVAKLWLREVHIMWEGYGDHLLAHELAHIFTEPFGAGPLRLSMYQGVGVNMGLVEGIATAADWQERELSMHEAAGALRRLELAPDIRRLVGATGFWTQSSGKAYTLMGSFVRHLVDTEGMEKFKKVYANGDFEAAYGQSSDALVTRWEAYVDALPLSRRKLDLAAYYYRRPSIFKKVCARTIADLNRQARLARSSGQNKRAMALYEQIVAYDPERIDFRMAQARMLEFAKMHDQALGLVATLLAKPDLVPAQRAQLLELQGDIAWLGDKVEEARAAYKACQTQGVPDGAQRLVAVKLASLEQERQEVRGLARAYLLERPDVGVSLYYPLTWAQQVPGDDLGQMLVGRRLWGAKKWSEAIPYLSRAAQSSELDVSLMWETRYILAQCYMFMGHWVSAKELFEEVRDKAESSRHVIAAKEWLERVTWLQEEGKAYQLAHE